MPEFWDLVLFQILRKNSSFPYNAIMHERITEKDNYFLHTCKCYQTHISSKVEDSWVPNMHNATISRGYCLGFHGSKRNNKLLTTQKLLQMENWSKSSAIGLSKTAAINLKGREYFSLCSDALNANDLKSYLMLRSCE